MLMIIPSSSILRVTHHMIGSIRCRRLTSLASPQCTDRAWDLPNLLPNEYGSERQPFT